MSFGLATGLYGVRVEHSVKIDLRVNGKGCDVAEWEKQIGAINLIVGDLERSKAFYQEVFGLPLQHEDQDTAMFRFSDTYVFLQRGAAHRDESLVVCQSLPRCGSSGPPEQGSHR